MLQLRPLTTSVLVAAVAFGLALMTPAAFAVCLGDEGTLGA